MNNLVFPIALFFCFFSFGQNNFELGNYTKLINKGIEFKYKNPLSPFLKAEESYSLQGNTNLVTAFYARISDEIFALQIYATTVPHQFENLDWKVIINSDEVSKKFLDSFLLGTNKNTAMKISSFNVKTINGKVFLEVQSTITTSGLTQKQINWITVYKNTFVNILGATFIDSFDKNLYFFTEFSHSVLIN
jgi:hypothetical protein